MLSTPVALIIYRRPYLTEKVLDAVRAVKPTDLYVIADGPRPDKLGEAEACAAARAVIDSVDWGCQVHRCYSETNLGCGHRPASGMDWLFEQVESAIILEDDCIPHSSFFSFCQELLERYKDDERVMHISGCTYRPETWDTDDSYFFSHFPACWGWATWARAWKQYDIHCGDWPVLRDKPFLSDLIGKPFVEKFWGDRFDEANQGDESLHFWDYQWAFNCWAHNGLSIFPKQNLVCNIGAGDSATHTTGDGLESMGLPTFEMQLPLRHPDVVAPNAAIDKQYVQEFLLPAATPRQRHTSKGVRGVVKRLLPQSVKQRVKQLIS